VKANILALLAAFAFALGNVLQQKGTLEAPAQGDNPRFLVQILRRPVWLAGGASQMVGWILQAVALDTGSLIVVQSLTTMSLVIALPLGRRITGQEVTRQVWVGAAAMVAGILLFLSVGSPQGGTSTPPASAWWSAGLSAIVLIVVLGRMGRTRQGAPKALLFGSAAGVAFALQAAVTKVFVTVVGQGISAVLSSWTIYVLIASALVGFVLQQSALKTDILAPAMASSNAVTLFGSVVFGATVFGEKLSSGGARLAPAVIGLGVALIGIVLLAGAKPPQASQGMPRIDQITRDDGEGPPSPSGP
jgi:drug/metabolite transporter (DMT)-like permease